MTSSHELASLIDEQGRLLKSRFGSIDGRIDDLERRINRPGGGTPSNNNGLTSPSEKKALDAVLTAWVRGDSKGLDAAMTEFKAMRAGVDSDGGYFVPIESGRMLRRMAEVSPIVGMTTTVQLREGMALEGVEDLNSFASTWVGEEEDRPETTSASVGKYRVELHEIYAMPSFTAKLLDQAEIDVQQWALGRIYESFAVAEELAIISGTGVGQPRGITTLPTAATADGSRAWGTMEHVVSGASGAFASSNPADPLIDLSLKLKPQYRQGAAWFMSRSTAASIRKFKEATTNAYIWQPGLQQGQPDRLLGFPVTYVEQMPAVAANSLSIAFGDMAACYTTVRRPGIKLLVDPYTDKPRVKLYVYSRVGGAPINTEAVKFLKFST
jgi:HK97 family phage major capsid protein